MEFGGDLSAQRASQGVADKTSLERDVALADAAEMLDVWTLGLNNARKIFDAALNVHKALKDAPADAPSLLDIWQALPRDGKRAVYGRIVKQGRLFDIRTDASQADSEIAYIFPVGWVPTSATSHVATDLVAVIPTTPDEWWLMDGAANWGSEEVIACDNPIILQPNPWAWVKSGFKGTFACHNQALLDLYWVNRPVVCTSLKHAQHVRNVFKAASLESPKLLVPRG